MNVVDDDLLLPGTIPGLLRRGSPVLIADGRGGHCGRAVVLIACSDFPILAAVGGIDTGREDCATDVEAEYGEVGLDLSDPTGLIHAVWWMASLDEQRFPAAVSALGLDVAAFRGAFEQAFTGRPLDRREIGMIRRVGLYLAGVSDAD